MQEHELWLENPPKGTEVCLGFDGSENDDWTCIKAETREGFIFTPRYGEDRRPTIWNPKTWGGRIPRSEVNAAMDELNERYKVIRAYPINCTQDLRCRQMSTRNFRLRTKGNKKNEPDR